MHLNSIIISLQKSEVTKLFTYDALTKSLKDTEQHYMLFGLNTCIKIYTHAQEK